MSALAKAATMFRSRPGARKVGPIGIDFGLEAVHLVQLETADGDSPIVRARSSLPFETPRQEILANPQLFKSLIKKAMSADSFHGRDVVMAVPSGMFRTLSINYQAGGDHDDATQILKIMQHRLDGDLSDFVLDYLPVRNRSKNDEKLALVAVSEREPVVKLLEAARRARLNVDALEIGPVAISRLVGALSEVSDYKNVLVINSGRQASYLTLLSGDDLLFDQQVNFGENELIHVLAETLDMSEEMARDLALRAGVERVGDTVAQIVKPSFLQLAEEIKRVCLYAAAETRGGSVSQIFLLGSIAHWPGSETMLASMIDVAVSKVPDPLAPFEKSGAVADSAVPSAAPEIAVATGLALRGIHGRD